MNALELYRSTHPRARRTGPTAIIRSGSRQTVRSCVCGDIHTESTRHRGQTKHVREWLREHAGCLEKWAKTQR